MICRAATLVLLALLAGCRVDADFDDTRFACSDGRCPDGYRCVEARCELEAPRDGGPEDGAVDAEPDAALLTCDEQFGGASGYVLCAEAPDRCEFYNTSAVSTACADICAVYGAACLEAYDADPAATCTREEAGAGCDVLHQTQICICSRGSAS